MFGPHAILAPSSATGEGEMGNEAKNVDMLKEAYRRWHDSKGGSVDHWMGLVADDINFASIARGAPSMAFARSYTDRKMLKGYFEGLLRDWEMISYTASEFVAQGDVVFMRGSCAWRNKKTGKSVVTPKVDYWRFRDSKAVEFYEYFDTAAAIAAATNG
jgi:ketosteroid isomerase-like protein